MKMMCLFTDKKNNSHIEKVNDSKGEHYLSRHSKYTEQYFFNTINCFPGADHQGCIPQVQEVITNQQYPVNRVRKVFIAVQQAEDIQSSVSVKPETHMNRNDVSDEQVEEVSESVHTGRFKGEPLFRYKGNQSFRIFNIF